ncbi:hypothetical protein ACWIG5_24540 [Streptomyces lydicus]
MIRIVTRARLSGLQQDVVQARARTREVQETADRAFSGHTRSAQRMTAQLKAAQREADRARTDALDLQRALDDVKAQLAAAHDRATGQAARIDALTSDLSDVLGAVVLLHYGKLHSLHRTTLAAEQHAQSIGAVAGGWGPASSLPDAEVSWRIRSLGSFSVPGEEESG